MRRGLPGEILIKFSGLTHIPLVWTVAALQIVCLLCFAISLWWLVGRVFRTSTPIWPKALLLSPATLAFFWFDPVFILRKEVALFAILGVLVLLLHREAGASDTLVTLYLALGCPLLLLSHEGLICYTPYMFALVCLKRRSVRRAAYICAVPAALSLISVIIAARYTGNGTTADLICRSVGGPTTGLCTGPIYYLGVSRGVYEAEVRLMLHDTRTMIAFGITTTLALLPVVAGLADLWHRPVSRETRLVLPLACALSATASLVLFLEAQDWTRWIYIHLVCLLLVLLSAVEHRRATGVPILRHAKQAGRSRALVIVLLFGYATAWHLPALREYKPFGYGSLLLRLERHTSEKFR